MANKASSSRLKETSDRGTAAAPLPGWIERVAERLRLIPDLHGAGKRGRRGADEAQGPVPEQSSGSVADAVRQVSERGAASSAEEGSGAGALPRLTPPGRLTDYPPPERWDDWSEYEAKSWPRRDKRNYVIVPTACFNCEAGCGLLSYVDRDSLEVRKFEGNPWHPGSRGRNCAKGPATINQINDPDRILYPLRRKGQRGEGGWERVSWDQALEEIASRIRQALIEDRRDEVVYHVGRPGHEGYAERVLAAWGVDGHNSHTNICSAGARFGYAAWQGYDRPSPDHAQAEFILLVSAHLESGHYFNPHAQRIIEGMMKGAKLAVMDPRLSNTASMADFWMPTYPGSEAAVLLAMARVLLVEDLIDRDFLRDWVNWEDYLAAHSAVGGTFEDFLRLLAEDYAEFTPELAEEESGVPAATVVEVARRIGRAGSRFATHNWRSASSGNLGGWTVSRALHFLNVLTGSVGTPGGTLPSAWNKFKPDLFDKPPAHRFWNRLHFPDEYPLSHYEMSFLLPHFLKEGRGKLDVYFTRVFNPVWTYPDGFSWIEALSDPAKIGLHAALTPTWSETAFFADFVLPMGHAGERHDLISYETHSGLWIAFRQPVLREARRRMGEEVEFTYQANPGEVWEEDEFWIELSWRIDPDGELGVRKHFESPYRPGQKVTVEEYYRWIFEHTPGLPEKAAEHDLSPLDYMRRFGAFEVEESCYRKHETPVGESALTGSLEDERGVLRKDGQAVGVRVGAYADREETRHAQEGSASEQRGVGSAASSQQLSPAASEQGDEAPHAVNPICDERPEDGPAGQGNPRRGGRTVQGFPTPSRKQEIYSSTLAEWGWPEYAAPCYIKSHIHPEELDRSKGEIVLVPTFRLPTLIHSRSGNSKWLNEISNRNPVWLHPQDAEMAAVGDGDLLRVETDIGYFIDRVWVTEAMRPGVAACSHHLGRWRREQDPPANRWATNLVEITRSRGKETGITREDGSDRQHQTSPGGLWTLRYKGGIAPGSNADPDTQRIFWREGGVHQNIAFPVHPDPISGMHCWHQRVRLSPPRPGDRYGDVQVDTRKSFEIYRQWLEMTRPGPGPGGWRRPLWLNRPLRPVQEAFRHPEADEDASD
ncbi:MAG TPA: molybdopterin-dependent oxidoreductase [Acidobacteriota bacterium]|nr:molybdopterin-dependent oxidoreductase [Acidobacteriota bacterium]